MSLDAIDDDRVQRLLDGDLAPGEADAARAELDDAGRAALDGHRRLGEAMRAAARGRDAEAALRPDESDALFARITAAAAEPAEAEGAPRLRALPGGATAPRRPARGRWVGVGALAAAAAAVLAWLGSRPGPTPVADAGPASAPAAEARTEVLAVDFGQNTGTVFEVEGDEGERLAVVVWIEDPAPLAGGGG